MDAGRIVERGSHQGLLASGGRYARMWQLQNSAAHRAADSADASQETPAHGHQVA